MRRSLFIGNDPKIVVNFLSRQKPMLSSEHWATLALCDHINIEKRLRCNIKYYFTDFVHKGVPHPLFGQKILREKKMDLGGSRGHILTKDTQ